MTIKPKLKARNCAHCRVRFDQARLGQRLCSIACTIAWTEANREKRAKKAQKAAKAQHRVKLDDSKRLSHWLKLTERVVNHYILTRDADEPCISCGTTVSALFQAGHYLSVGARPELRFNPLNINKQCHRCNVYLSGNQAAYRPSLVTKAGASAVESLEGPHATAKYTRDGLEQLRKHFAAETRKLKAQR